MYRSDKDKITLKAIEKHGYGLRKTVSKHLNSERTKEICLITAITLNFFKDCYHKGFCEATEILTPSLKAASNFVGDESKRTTDW